MATRIHAHSFGHDKLLGAKLDRSGTKVPFLTFADDTVIFCYSFP